MRSLLKDFDYRDKMVLDFGCGVGSSSYMFNSDYYMGVDYDSNRIHYAKELFPDYNFKVVKDINLPIADGTIDYILIMAVMHHIPAKDLSKYLQEFNRILAPNGKVIVIEPCFFENSKISNWFMESFDKGRYIRDESGYTGLFLKEGYNASIIKRFRKCVIYRELFFVATPRA